MASIFSKIVNKEIPSYKVAENDRFYAFLDINPLAKGHTLVIPKKEIDYLFDLDEKTYNELFVFTRKVAMAIERAIDCVRLGMIVYGLDVPHAHIHLVPLQGTGNELNFSKPKLELSKEDFEATAKKILDEFESDN
ncbi:MAG: HIT family protein [Bacteroidales bacterium]|nr:HIT family protein [Bacteroidales bacterium]